MLVLVADILCLAIGMECNLVESTAVFGGRSSIFINKEAFTSYVETIRNAWDISRKPYSLAKLRWHNKTTFQNIRQIFRDMHICTAFALNITMNLIAVITGQ